VTEPRPALPTPIRSRRLHGACALALACLAVASCGKKGPPLPPLVKLPIAPTEVSAKRVGERVVVRFTIPTRSQSGVLPPDIEWVEVYSWVPPAPTPGAPAPATGSAAASSGTALLPEQIFKYAKLVGRVQVRKPPPPPPEQKEGQPPPPPPPPPSGPGLDQGVAAEVVDTLGPADAEPIVVPVKTRKAPKVVERVIRVTPPDVGPPLPPLPTRLYAVVGVSHRGKRGTLSQPIRVPLWTAPPAPADLVATVREGAVDLAWKAPGGMRQPLVTNLAPTPLPTTGAAASRPGGQGAAAGAPGMGRPGDGRPQGPPPAVRPPPSVEDDPDEEDEEDVQEAQALREAAMAQAAQARAEAAKAAGQPAPEPAAAAGAPLAAPAAPAGPGATLASRVPFPWPATNGGFGIYEVLPDGAAPPAGAPAPPAVQPFPKPLTASPQKAATFTDPRLEFGVSRCYVVRTSETVGTLAMESAPSAPVCVSASDTFAPKAPQSLGAVSSGGAISLIWEANAEPDLAGYLVLRALNDGPLEPITPEPIKETTYRDARVRRGNKYAYVVVAVDTAKPPNRSAQSNRVEETVR
jgi:hypothetical protein